MTTTSFVWRPRAKMVAFVDLSLSVINLVIVVVVAILSAIAVAVIGIVANHIEKENSENGSESENGNGSTSGTSPTQKDKNAMPVWVLWVGVAVHLAIAVLGLWAGYKLLKSTDLKKTTKQALSGARFWFYLSILLLLITIPINVVIYEMYVITGIGFLIRVALMFVVFQYMEELKVAINAANISQVAPI